MNSKRKKKKMKEKKENSNMVSEPMAMTYGMSDNLVNSGLLTQISDLSTKDKQYLMRYIAQEVAEEEAEDEWECEDTSDLTPYTIDELRASLEESHQQYLKGEYMTEAEVREELNKKF